MTVEELKDFVKDAGPTDEVSFCKVAENEWFWLIKRNNEIKKRKLAILVPNNKRK